MLSSLLQPKGIYLGHKSSLLSVEILREAYMLAFVNLKRARDKTTQQDDKRTPKI